jgi:hypothetical protein
VSEKGALKVQGSDDINISIIFYCCLKTNKEQLLTALKADSQTIRSVLTEGMKSLAQLCSLIHSVHDSQSMASIPTIGLDGSLWLGSFENILLTLKMFEKLPLCCQNILQTFFRCKRGTSVDLV